MNYQRLIESAFPLKQVSLDSVHEKNVRHGHISTLHIWPARRPLAASRAALLATLLPDPGSRDARRKLLERMAGRVVEVPSAGGERMKEETRGGIFHWGREDSGELARFREEIREAFGGRAPRVLDPFAGGGAIPLEAMRLGCEAVAADINPVAWFILRCTLHYPRLLAGEMRPLPAFALGDRGLVEGFLKAHGVTKAHAVREELARYGHGDGEAVQVTSPYMGSASPAADADFAWHLRAWGRRVLAGARRTLAARYPTYAEFEPVRRKGRGRSASLPTVRYRSRSPKLLEPDEDGRVSVASLNAEFDSFHLENEANPRWVAKPAVAYLWARTVRCGDCRAEVPLLKTRWLCKTAKKRVLLTMEPWEDGAGVAFGVERGVPEGSGSVAQKREHDRNLGAGTMSGSGAKCPCCGAIVTTRDIRTEGRAGRIGERMTAVVVDGQEGKEYRLPTEVEMEAACVAEEELDRLYKQIPFGLPGEPVSPDRPSPNSRGASGLPRYGFGTWRQLFTNRQLLALGTFVREIRHNADLMSGRAALGHDSESSELPPPWNPGFDADRLVAVDAGRPAMKEQSVSWERRRSARNDSRDGTPDAYGRGGTSEPDAGNRDGIPKADVGSWERGRPARKEDAGQQRIHAGGTPAFSGSGGPSAPDLRSVAVAGGMPAFPGYPSPPFLPDQAARTSRSGGMTSSCAEPVGDYPEEWREALVAYLALSISRLADRGCALATWQNNSDKIGHAFARFALPMVWDFAESCPLADTTGGFIQAIEWVARVVEHAEAAATDAPIPNVVQRSATEPLSERFDLVCTDPPYYDAIPYSDLMDFFHVWLRRTLHGLSPETDAAFVGPLGPKWDHDTNDGELIDQPSRFDANGTESRRAYEDGMLRTFQNCRDAIRDDGRMVIVFANKQPEAWETLVSALIRAGFVVDASWPIQTEREAKVAGGARLSSSIWLVCKKRPATARLGWDGKVLAEMQEHIVERLRDFWDAGIRGPDFVWAATGPALEAFSRHPVVRKADRADERLTVAEFLSQVRRMVVGFVVSRLLQRDGGATDELDDPTTYYLLHRNDFGLGAAPAGACILYALSCNLSDADLAGRLDLLARGTRAATVEAPEAPEGEDGAEGRDASGSEARLKPWNRRRARDLGEPPADGGAPPLIDRVHKLMQLWKTGEQSRVDAYLESQGLWRHELFARIVQALIELAEGGSEERATLESIQNHVRTRGGAPALRQESLL